MRIFSWPGHETFALSLEANIVTDFCDEFLDGVLLTVFCFLWLGIPRGANIAMIGLHDLCADFHQLTPISEQLDEFYTFEIALQAFVDIIERVNICSYRKAN